MNEGFILAEEIKKFGMKSTSKKWWTKNQSGFIVEWNSNMVTINIEFWPKFMKLKDKKDSKMIELLFSSVIEVLRTNLDKKDLFDEQIQIVFVSKNMSLRKILGSYFLNKPKENSVVRRIGSNGLVYKIKDVKKTDLGDSISGYQYGYEGPLGKEIAFEGKDILEENYKLLQTEYEI